MSKRTAPLLALAAGLAGCYQYAPPSSGPVASGREVRAVLTDSGARALGQTVGEGVQWVDGRLLSSPADSAVTLAVTETTTRSGHTTPWSGENVSIPRGYVATFEQKVLSRPHTATLLGVAAMLAVGTYAALRSSPNSGGAVSGGGGGAK